MKQFVRIALCVALLAVAFGPSFAEGDVTLEGEFVWTRDDGDRTGPLKAIFTPAEGKNEWTVAFHFDWEDGPHVYTGTAKGNLKKGGLSGDVMTDNEERRGNFRFKGKFNKKGMFEGTHVSVRDGEENPMGSLTLKAAG